MSEEVGAMPPPEGVTPNFGGTTYLQHTVIIVYSVTFAIATITMILRLYTAGVIVKKVGWDSPLLVLSWAVSLAFFICMVLAMPAGFGKHMWDVRGTEIQGYLNLLLVLALTYIWPPTLTKLAILVLFHRIIPNKTFRLLVWVVALSLFGYTVVFTALFAGPCNPQSTGSGACLNNIAVAQAILNIVTDGILIIMPIPMIHSLNMPLKQRIVVGGILALGSGVILASCVRVAYVRQMQNNPDFTWTQASAAVWSSVELNVGIICNCLATLKPFVRKHLPWLGSLVGGSSANKSYPNPGSTGNSFRPWRGDNVTHGYQLHSVDRAKQPNENEPNESNGKGIVIVDEYRVQYDGRRENGDASSTDDILASEPYRPYNNQR